MIHFNLRIKILRKLLFLVFLAVASKIRAQVMHIKMLKIPMWILCEIPEGTSNL